MVSLPKEFKASLESYHGPLDLLLYLIKKEEVDVFDIPIAKLVQQYQLYLEIIKNVDPNTCGDFLVMAARLMEIKSKLLLPREILEA
ncbi:MAG: segregation/condensation protein A, partial [Planctomycetota bacterium]